MLKKPAIFILSSPTYIIIPEPLLDKKNFTLWNFRIAAHGGVCPRAAAYTAATKNKIARSAQRPWALHKGLVAILYGLLLVHAVWIEAEIPQKSRRLFEELERIAPLKNAIRATAT
ncbi:MAG: hypothetical protein LBC67_04860 [Spirochaetales bacterium]|nr:hypothetical protein [Spirochaetales bacterium]